MRSWSHSLKACQASVHHMLFLSRMRRCLHIAISLMAVVLLVRPFDCFAASEPSRKAADCCLKGKCAPTANSDECCKNTAPDRDQLARTKAADHSYPLIAFVIQIPTIVAPTFEPLSEPVRHPPPRMPLIAPALPLLI